MKVRIQFTIDIDADSWCEAYATDRQFLRQDIKDHIEQSVRMHIEELGFAPERKAVDGPATKATNAEFLTEQGR